MIEYELTILLAAMKYDYGIINRGLALDYYYFEEPLKKMGFNVITFDYMSIFQEKGKVQMNQDLSDLISSKKPDLVIVVPFTDQFIPETMEKIKKSVNSVVYFFDDVWRIEYSKFWSTHFTYATTSDVNGVNKWSKLGYNNFIYSPFGVNHNLYVKKDIKKQYDVSFVGGYHPHRDWIIKRLKRAGINVITFGYGWPNGKLEFDEVVNIFNESKINLNLSNNESYDLKYILPFYNNFNDSLKVIKRTLINVFKKDSKTKEMVKARHFEINACGGFQLTFNVEGLETHYAIGEEIVTFGDVDDLIDKIIYYLKNDHERETIAYNGYLRTLKYHTMEKRLNDLINAALKK